MAQTYISTTMQASNYGHKLQPHSNLRLTFWSNRTYIINQTSSNPNHGIIDWDYQSILAKILVLFHPFSEVRWLKNLQPWCCDSEQLCSELFPNFCFSGAESWQKAEVTVKLTPWGIRTWMLQRDVSSLQLALFTNIKNATTMDFEWKVRKNSICKAHGAQSLTKMLILFKLLQIRWVWVRP